MLKKTKHSSQTFDILGKINIYMGTLENKI